MHYNLPATPSLRYPVYKQSITDLKESNLIRNYNSAKLDLDTLCDESFLFIAENNETEALRVVESHKRRIISDDAKIYAYRLGVLNNGGIELLMALINEGVDPSETTIQYQNKVSSVLTQHGLYRKSYLIIWAAEYGHFELVRFLIARNVDPNTPNRWNDRAIDYAARNNHVDIVKYLVRHGAHPNLEDFNGQRPIHMAAAHGRLEIFKFLVDDCGVGARDADNLGWHSLHFAVEGGHIEVAKYILENGLATAYDRNSEGDDAFSLAAKYKHNKAVSECLAKFV
jgi:Ankyrin repeats (3 copies)/Ankyrin repeats (many copies)